MSEGVVYPRNDSNPEESTLSFGNIRVVGEVVEVYRGGHQHIVPRGYTWTSSMTDDLTLAITEDRYCVPYKQVVILVL